MNICPNCGTAILGHPKECTVCKFDLEKFESLSEEEQNRIREEKYQERLRENPELYAKKVNPFEEDFQEKDFYGTVLGICSICIGVVIGALMGSIGAFVGLVLGVIGLIITINASKSYSHGVGAGFILSILGTIFSLWLFLGWTCFGLNDGYSYFGVCGVGCHEINQTCNSFHCPG